MKYISIKGATRGIVYIIIIHIRIGGFNSTKHQEQALFFIFSNVRKYFLRWRYARYDLKFNDRKYTLIFTILNNHIAQYNSSLNIQDKLLKYGVISFRLKLSNESQNYNFRPYGYIKITFFTVVLSYLLKVELSIK